MGKKFFSDRFKSFVAAQYGHADPNELPERQRLEVEDAYYAGALIGFYQGIGCDDQEAIDAQTELSAFGDEIIKRYERAGLPLGQRRS